jgi:Protein of unknown function (DUF3551)
MRTIALAVTVVAVSVIHVPRGHAQGQPLEVIYPYCWNKSLSNQNNNCGFTSFAQCERYRGSLGGYCSDNPLYRGPPPGSVVRKKKSATR